MVVKDLTTFYSIAVMLALGKKAIEAWRNLQVPIKSIDLNKQIAYINKKLKEMSLKIESLLLWFVFEYISHPIISNPLLCW